MFSELLNFVGLKTASRGGVHEPAEIESCNDLQDVNQSCRWGHNWVEISQSVS